MAGGTINYTYDATGVKLRKVVSGTTTDYAGNYIYKNNVLEFFNHPEGYVQNNSGSFSYVYQYKDHLGNIRLSYSDANNNGSITQNEIIEESNYYPFGGLQKGYNNVVSSSGNASAQKFKFGGKELNEELGLNTYDFGARNYDPYLGRWFGVDALAEKYYSASPYVYTANNPIYYTEIDGRCYTKNDDGDFVACDDGENGDVRDGFLGNSWTFGDDGWQLTDVVDPNSVDPDYIPVTITGSEDYYIERYKKHIEKYGTRPPDYYLEYGHKYIRKFKNETKQKLSKKGKKWLDRTAIALQTSMESGIMENPSIQFDNEEFGSFAYDTHVPAYMNSGLSELPPMDLLQVGNTPDAKDLFSTDGIKQGIKVYGLLLILKTIQAIVEITKKN